MPRKKLHISLRIAENQKKQIIENLQSKGVSNMPYLTVFGR